MVQSGIQINVNGNAAAQISNLQSGLNGLTNTASRLDTAFGRAFQSAFAFNNITQALDGFKNSLNTVTAPLIDFDRKSREMAAITGSTKEEIDGLNSSAKELSYTYGTDASQNIDMFKVALSKLTPELGQSNDFMKAFGETANRLSLTMSGDVDGATRAITNSLNQYGVDLSNPIEATQKMQEMMDMVARSAQVGAVEVPGIASALQLTGNMAYNAGVKFEELQALMQVTGKFAEEGRIGYVLRDMFLTMNKGDFIPKEVMTRMSALGINVQALQSPTTNTRDKLMELNKLLKDPSAFNQLFGQYANEAGALVRNIGLYDEYVGKIGNAGGALKTMSDIIAEGYGVQMKNVNNRIIGFKIAIGEAMGISLPWIETIVGGTSSLLQFASGLNQTWQLLRAMRELQVITRMTTALGLAQKWQALMQWQVNIATYAFPGLWIIAGLAAVVGAVMYAWNKFEGFRKFLFVLWESAKTVFANIGGFVAKIFEPIGEIISAFQNNDWVGVGVGAAKLGANLVAAPIAFAKYVADGELTKGLANAGEKGKALGAASFAEDNKQSGTSGVMSPGKAIASGGKITPGGALAGGAEKKAGGGAGGGGGSGKFVNIKIEKLVEKIEVHSTTLKEGVGEIRKIVAEAIIAAVSDAETSIAIG